MKWLAAFALVLIPALAQASPLIDSVGARVGGYGFREVAGPMPSATETTDWNACRMNGVGVFATHSLTPTFFVEGGLDTYFTDSFALASSQSDYATQIDRVSALVTASVGARWFPDAIISPYVQVGLGTELTRARLPALGLEDSAILPMGFFGVGGNLRLGKRLSVGAALRVNAMGYYDDSQFQAVMNPSAELATQGQFFASYSM